MRDSLRHLEPTDAQNAGLLLSRYLHDPEKRSDLLQGAIAASRDIGIYTMAFNRRAASFPGDALHLSRKLRTRSRLIVGLGSDNVLEAGIRLDHTYGVPVIPGSALKGLAAHHCHLSYGPSDASFLRGGTCYSLLFGKSDDCGCIAFDDAWPEPESLANGALKLDVMTPHHQKWQLKGAVAPTDFDSPVPVSFLSVVGSFEFRVSWRGASCEDATEWTAHAMAILIDALGERGVGGKTTSGYGRLEDPANAVRAQVASPSVQLRPNDSVKVKLTTRTRSGGWNAIHEPSGLSGTITDTTNTLAGKTVGETVQVWIHSVNRTSLQFKTAQPPPIRRQPFTQRGRR
jgi:CRISPR-associated protein Cmr6